MSFFEIKNPRTVGSTIVFIFETFDDINGSVIVIGNDTAMITLPNLANVSFNPLLQYYKSNTEPVSFISNFTNKLE
jgi:hypothetical protein